MKSLGYDKFDHYAKDFLYRYMLIPEKLLVNTTIYTMQYMAAKNFYS